MLSDICMLLVLILLNGVLTCGELAIVSANENRLRERLDSSDRRLILILNIKENVSSFIAALQIGKSVIAIFSGAYAAYVFFEPLNRFFSSFGIRIFRSVTILLTTIIISYFISLLGELIPKRLAMAKPVDIAIRLVRFIHPFNVFFKPFAILLSKSVDLCLKISGISTAHVVEITEDEIRTLMETGGEKGNIDENEIVMINNVFEFDDKTAEDIATHRTDIVALPVDCGIDNLIDTVLTKGFSRIPVYEDSIDNIIGILYVRDLTARAIKGAGLSDIQMKDIIRNPYFVPISKKTDELFEQMRKDKIHMAIVVDEYGGTNGIVTMEDLIEEIMGNILDEFDHEEQPEIEPIDKNTFVVNGSISIEDAAEFFEIKLPIEDYDTLSGFFISQLGRIPEEGETPEIEYEGILLKLYEMDEKRIKSLIVCKI